MSFFRKKFTRSDGRKPTSSALNVRFTDNELPSPPEPKKLEVTTRPAPSYAHADKQKGEQDKEAEDREHEDEALRIEEGKDPKDPEQPKTNFEAPSNKVVKNERHTGPSTSASLTGSTPFNRFWKLELEYDLEEEVEAVANFWTPNANAMFEVLLASGKYVYDNATVLKRHADYLDYAVACYYSILFYIQILRCQKTAGKLHGMDRSFINRFKDKFPFEELPVSSIMEPYLTTIVATLPKDGKYDWIVPEYNTGIFRRHFAAISPGGNGACYIQPMVPYMLRILRSSITAARQTAINANPDQFFNDDDIYVPRIFVEDEGRAFCAQNYRQNRDANDGRNTLFSNCGVSYPFFANQDQLAVAAPKWRKSKFKNFVYGDTADAGPTPNIIVDIAQRPATALEKGHLDEFLHMEKTADTDWFYELIRQAALHARFFEGVTNLSKIPTTSGNEPLVLGKLKKIVGGNEEIHADVNLGMNAAAAGVPDWYPTTFRGDYRAEFFTSREGVERQETLQAFSFATNSTIGVTHAGSRVGEGALYRTGPYWNNQQWAATKFHNAGTVGKPMYRGWETMFQDDAALEKPTGY